MAIDDPFEKVAWLQPAELGGWEYLIAERSRHLWTVFHESYDLCACARWDHRWHYRGRVHSMHGAGVMLLEPGEMHRTLSVPHEAVFKVAIVPADAVASAATELGCSGSVHLAGASTADPELTNAIWQLGLTVERGGGSKLEVQSMQASVLLHLLRQAERPVPAAASGAPGVAERARDYLRAHMALDVSLDQLACACACGRFQLLRAFRARWGVPPHAYQIQLRVHRARQMLRHGFSSGQIAADLGFCDQSHFIRHFRKVTGVTPATYSGRATGARIG